MLTYQAPISIIVLLLAVPFCEPMHGPKGLLSQWDKHEIVRNKFEVIYMQKYF